MRAVYRVLLGIVTIGWLVPAYFSIVYFFGYQRTELQALISHGKQAPVTFMASLYLGLAEDLFTVAFLWFSIVIAGWSLFLIARVLPAEKNNRMPNQSAHPTLAKGQR
jgi:hypothetical protein